ncbi:MAG TPA: hypothetical protein VJ964_03790, partial [Balneolaceae bacterium]|nr:hypothetical protein [Balneolaceae bacterium]
MDFVLSIRVAAAIIGFGLFMGCKSGNSRSQTQNLETRKVDVALAGNAYQTNPNGTDAIGKNGIESWKDDQSVFSIYLEVKDATKAKV